MNLNGCYKITTKIYLHAATATKAETSKMANNFMVDF